MESVTDTVKISKEKILIDVNKALPEDKKINMETLEEYIDACYEKKGYKIHELSLRGYYTEINNFIDYVKRKVGGRRKKTRRRKSRRRRSRKPVY
jgi:hypothetical protein